ncbi:MAG: ABC transporter permease [Verrucomicrobiae bacterium]|nr:ABC transporter permease [Verrucomicrobiae bacterium]
MAKRLIPLLSEHGMIVVLLLICGWYSVRTLKKQPANGAEGGRSLAGEVAAGLKTDDIVFVLAGTKPEDEAFAAAAEKRLRESEHPVDVFRGAPSEVKSKLRGSSVKPGALLCSPSTASWQIFDAVPESVPRFFPVERVWPDFLKRENLVNIADQIVVIAILAIGMTMVIITRGIDLSVGSLLALSAVATAWFIEKGGAEGAGTGVMVLASVGAIAICGAIGLFSGVMVTAFSIPPFIVTLAMMLVASGIAFDWSDNQSIHHLPASFTWLGRAGVIVPVLGVRIPFQVLLMIGLYLGAHGFMTRTVLGRHIYAIGGSPEAARLSGIPVARVLVFAYTACALLAGVGGVLMASQLESGAPTYGVTYELTVIAAVVVGGTSLHGGSGRIFGTFVGALIIAVIQNGMNLTGIDYGAQKYVLGVIILLAVLLDQLKRRWLMGRRE